jgi:hypothetical protein
MQKEITLFLDDDGNRTKTFVSRIPSALTHSTASSICQGIAAAKEAGEKIRYLFLDHDLGGEIHVDSAREDCGMEVVRFLAKNVAEYITVIDTIIVHSHNQPAAERMTYNLREFGYNTHYVPFIQLVKLLDDGLEKHEHKLKR